MQLCLRAAGAARWSAVAPSAASAGWVRGFPRRLGGGRRGSWERRRKESRRQPWSSARPLSGGCLSGTVAGTGRAAGRAEAGPALGSEDAEVSSAGGCSFSRSLSCFAPSFLLLFN